MKNPQKKCETCPHCGIYCTGKTAFCNPPIPSPTQSERYCVKCKMKFITADKSGTCPQCGGNDVPYTNQEIIQGIDKDITVNKPDTESWEEDFAIISKKLNLREETVSGVDEIGMVRNLIHQVEEKARRETRNEWFDMAEKAREEGRKEWLPTRQQEIDEAYQRGLHKGYEEEAVGCHEHCKEARQSTLREIMEMVGGMKPIYHENKYPKDFIVGFYAFKEQLKEKLQ